MHNFTLLLGIALTDVLAPNTGNFTVMPGSHIELARACSALGGGEAGVRVALPSRARPARDAGPAPSRVARVWPSRVACA